MKSFCFSPYALLVLVLVARTNAFQVRTVPATTVLRNGSCQQRIMCRYMSEEPAASGETEGEEESLKPEVVCPNCDLCDGSGRIAGGLGAVLPWIPIKAYRPCPNFIERGGNYQRAGQGLDEIAFGRENTNSNSNN